MIAFACTNYDRHYLLESQLSVFEQNVVRADTMAEELFDSDVAGGQLAAEHLSSAADNPEEYMLLLKASVPMYTAERHEMLTNAQRGYELARIACTGAVCMLPKSIRDFDTRIPPNGLPSVPASTA